MNNDFFRVVLPWPDWGLSPNARLDKYAKATLTKQHRQIARACSIKAIGYRNWVDAEVVFSVWLFRQPDKRRRDTGNMRAAVKSFQDGVFDALRIDDHAVKDEYLHLDGVAIDGEIELRIYEDVMQFLDDVVELAKGYETP